MQSHRYAPNPGTEYRVTAETVLELMYQDAKGNTRKAPVEKMVSVTSSRGYSSVKISLPEHIVQRFSKGSAAIQVGRLLSVVPKPLAHENNPLSAKEIAIYTGPFRAQAETVTEGNDQDMVIVRTMNRLINGLPDDRRAAEGDAKILWAKVIGDAPPAKPGKGLEYISKELRFCETISSDKEHPGGVGSGFRSCLESVHDDIIQDKTEAVWKLLASWWNSRPPAWPHVENHKARLAASGVTLLDAKWRSGVVVHDQILKFIDPLSIETAGSIKRTASWEANPAAIPATSCPTKRDARTNA